MLTFNLVSKRNCFTSSIHFITNANYVYRVLRFLTTWVTPQERYWFHLVHLGLETYLTVGGSHEIWLSFGIEYSSTVGVYPAIPGS